MAAMSNTHSVFISILVLLGAYSAHGPIPEYTPIIEFPLPEPAPTPITDFFPRSNAGNASFCQASDYLASQANIMSTEQCAITETPMKTDLSFLAPLAVLAVIIALGFCAHIALTGLGSFPRVRAFFAQLLRAQPDTIRTVEQHLREKRSESDSSSVLICAAMLVVLILTYTAKLLALAQGALARCSELASQVDMQAQKLRDAAAREATNQLALRDAHAQASDLAAKVANLEAQATSQAQDLQNEREAHARTRVKVSIEEKAFRVRKKQWEDSRDDTVRDLQLRMKWYAEQQECDYARWAAQQIGIEQQLADLLEQTLTQQRGVDSRSLSPIVQSQSTVLDSKPCVSIAAQQARVKEPEKGTSEEEGKEIFVPEQWIPEQWREHRAMSHDDLADEDTEDESAVLNRCAREQASEVEAANSEPDQIAYELLINALKKTMGEEAAIEPSHDEAISESRGQTFEPGPTPTVRGEGAHTTEQCPKTTYNDEAEEEGHSNDGNQAAGVKSEPSTTDADTTPSVGHNAGEELILGEEPPPTSAVDQSPVVGPLNQEKPVCGEETRKDVGSLQPTQQPPAEEILPQPKPMLVSPLAGSAKQPFVTNSALTPVGPVRQPLVSIIPNAASANAPQSVGSQLTDDMDIEQNGLDHTSHFTGGMEDMVDVKVPADETKDRTDDSVMGNASDDEELGRKDSADPADHDMGNATRNKEASSHESSPFQFGAVRQGQGTGDSTMAEPKPFFSFGLSNSSTAPNVGTGQFAFGFTQQPMGQQHFFRAPGTDTADNFNLDPMLGGPPPKTEQQPGLNYTTPAKTREIEMDLTATASYHGLGPASQQATMNSLHDTHPKSTPGLSSEVQTDPIANTKMDLDHNSNMSSTNGASSQAPTDNQTKPAPTPQSNLTDPYDPASPNIVMPETVVFRPAILSGTRKRALDDDEDETQFQHNCQQDAGFCYWRPHMTSSDGTLEKYPCSRSKKTDEYKCCGDPGIYGTDGQIALHHNELKFKKAAELATPDDKLCAACYLEENPLEACFYKPHQLGEKFRCVRTGLHDRNERCCGKPDHYNYLGHMIGLNGKYVQNEQEAIDEGVCLDCHNRNIARTFCYYKPHQPGRVFKCDNADKKGEEGCWGNAVLYDDSGVLRVPQNLREEKLDASWTREAKAEALRLHLCIECHIFNVELGGCYDEDDDDYMDDDDDPNDEYAMNDEEDPDEDGPAADGPATDDPAADGSADVYDQADDDGQAAEAKQANKDCQVDEDDTITAEFDASHDDGEQDFCYYQTHGENGEKHICIRKDVDECCGDHEFYDSNGNLVQYFPGLSEAIQDEAIEEQLCIECYFSCFCYSRPHTDDEISICSRAVGAENECCGDSSNYDSHGRRDHWIKGWTQEAEDAASNAGVCLACYLDEVKRGDQDSD